MSLPGIPRSGDPVSPTAHYTGHVWSRNGLSHPALGTLEGRLMFDALWPTMTVSRLLGGPTLEGMLLARHRVIDDLLAQAIEDGRVGQVIEVACGMSPRGWRFSERFGDELVYIEADLPDMAARKRRAFERIATPSDGHRVVEVDALADDGPRSLAAIASDLDPQRGLAIITEGLLTYFGDADVLGMWRRFARVLGGFDHGLYLSDLRLAGQNGGVLDRAFRLSLSTFVRRQVHAHCDSEEDAVEKLIDSGFESAELHRAGAHPAAGDARQDPAAMRVHIIEAWTTGPAATP